MNKEPSFIVTINDKYCIWQYALDFVNAEDLCIDDLIRVINKELNGKIIYSKELKYFNEN